MLKPELQQTKSNKTDKVVLLAIVIIISIIMFLIHDIIITNILAYKICKANPNPKTFITTTVEYPESIYWEDNIYPGFDKKDRLLMIRNYLDGVHLKTMALNGPDGMIYVYKASEEDWRESSIIQKESQDDWKNYFKKLDVEASKIAEQGKKYTRETMPRLNYSVIFNPVSLTSFERRYLWSDEVTITEERTNETIAYNRRLMRRWYMMLPDVGRGSQYYYPEAMCGLEVGGWLYNFDRKAFPVIRPRAGKFHGMNINNYLFKKIIKKGGEK